MGFVCPDFPDESQDNQSASADETLAIYGWGFSPARPFSAEAGFRFNSFRRNRHNEVCLRRKKTAVINVGRKSPKKIINSNFDFQVFRYVESA